MRIGQLLSKVENEWFVGRESELTLLTNLTFNDSTWKFLHVCGPAGMGKTTLLKKFQKMHSDKTVYYFSGLDGYPDKDLFLCDLYECITYEDRSAPHNIDEKSIALLLNKLAEERGFIVLILDTLDQWAPIHKWLREKWLPLLSTKIRFISSARFRLCDVWYRSPGWTGIIQELKIGTLKKKEIYDYLERRGVSDKQARYFIENYSKGVPFALQVLCDRVLENDGLFVEEEYHFKYLTQFLSKQLLSSTNQYVEFRDLLRIASLFWWFDYNLLNEVCTENITTTQFYQFCQLAVIERTEDGYWRVNDIVREWVNAEYKLFSPEEFESTMKKGINTLRRGLHSVKAAQRLNYVYNLLHLVQEGVPKSFSFAGSSSGFLPRPIGEADLPLIEDIFRKFILSLRPFTEDKWKQEQYLREVWTEEPSAFIGIWYEKMLAGFVSFVPLNEKTRLLFYKNPVYHQYIKGSELQEKEYLIWLISSAPEYDPDAISFLFRYLFSQMAEDKLITAISPFPDFIKMLETIGFKELDWYQEEYTEGVPFKLLQLDLRNRDLSVALHESHQPNSAKHEELISELPKMLKKIMMNYHKKDLDKEIDALFISLPSLENITDKKNFKLFLLKILNEMENQSEEKQIFSQILKMFYVQKAGSHELVASQLNLSTSTYYRYLKKSFEIISIKIMELL